jgi:hypothetical protein
MLLSFSNITANKTRQQDVADVETQQKRSQSVRLPSLALLKGRNYASRAIAAKFTQFFPLVTFLGATGLHRPGAFCDHKHHDRASRCRRPSPLGTENAVHVMATFRLSIS